jgi:hypothetical protein
LERRSKASAGRMSPLYMQQKSSVLNREPLIARLDQGLAHGKVFPQL